jgi:O-antigen ligase
VHGGSQRMAPIATASFVATGALIGPTVLGGRVTATAPGAGWSGAAEIAGLAAALGVAWLIAQRASRPRIAPLLTAAVCVVAVAFGTLVWGNHKDARLTSTGAALHDGSRTTPPSDFLHGRGHEWEAALRTWADHPLLGAGASAYYTASLAHQGRQPTRYAHDLPLELAAELGVPGFLLSVAIYVSVAGITARAINTPGLWLLAPAALAFLASNLVDWTWHLAGLAALWASAAGALQGVTSHAVSTRRRPG